MSDIALDDAARGIQEFTEVFATSHPRLSNALINWFEQLRMMLQVFSRGPPTEQMTTWLAEGQPIMGRVMNVLTVTRKRLISEYQKNKDALRLVDRMNGKLPTDYESVENQFLRSIWRVVDMTYDLLGCKKSWNAQTDRWYMQLVHDRLFLAEREENRRETLRGNPRQLKESRTRAYKHRKRAFDTCRSLDALRVKAGR